MSRIIHSTAGLVGLLVALGAASAPARQRVASPSSTPRTPLTLTPARAAMDERAGPCPGFITIT